MHYKNLLGPSKTFLRCTVDSWWFEFKESKINIYWLKFSKVQIMTLTQRNSIHPQKLIILFFLETFLLYEFQSKVFLTTYVIYFSFPNLSKNPQKFAMNFLSTAYFEQNLSSPYLKKKKEKLLSLVDVAIG